MEGWNRFHLLVEHSHVCQSFVTEIISFIMLTITELFTLRHYVNGLDKAVCNTVSSEEIIRSRTFLFWIEY